MFNLSFPSKVIERTVAEQFVAYLQVNDLLPHFQSANRRHHSTETALLRVLSDVYAATDRQGVTLLGLLDLSAKFDCVDHDILVYRLRQSFDVDPIVLSWMDSASLLPWGSVDVDCADPWCTTRLGIGSIAVYFVHSQAL